MKKLLDKRKTPATVRPMKAGDLFKQIRKPMPQPSHVMGERKRKNAYTRKEKHKQGFYDQGP